MTNTRDSASPIDAVNEELIDTLIAISVKKTGSQTKTIY